MDAEELAEVVHAKLFDAGLNLGDIRGSSEYAHLRCEDDKGNVFMIKIIQLNADDGIEDNHEDCVHTHVDIDE